MDVMVILGEGGHTTEILELVDMLGSIYDYSYLIACHDQISEGQIRIAGSVLRTVIPRTKPSKFFETLKLSFFCSIQEFMALLKARPKAIITVGAGIAVPISIFGRLSGVKIIYIETISRVRALSITGKIMYHIAHLFFVQWEPLKEKYPKAIYAGRLL